MQTLSSPFPEKIVRPPVRHNAAGLQEVFPGTPFGRIRNMLDNGIDICIGGTYGFAMSFYSWLKQQMGKKFPIWDYNSSRAYKHAWYDVRSKIWMGIENGVPLLEKAPQNPWLKSFYPDKNGFFITFSDFLGMNGARQWYDRGIRYPVIDHAVHPFYGVYFPTRHSHLRLFDDWIGSAKGFHRAADIGTGCGILSFIMLKHGVHTIHATDINPNAIYSIGQDIHRLGISHGDHIFPEHANLLGSFLPKPEDLIAFNPPWIPEQSDKILDQGCYYTPGFFERFFREMKEKCPPGTRIAILFSDFALLAGVAREHPIAEALQLFEKDFTMELCEQRPVSEKPSKTKSWIHSIRDQEKVELYIIKKK